MELGVCLLPTELRRAERLAGAVEQSGVRWLGVADSPLLFGAMYPTVQHVLASTWHLRVGPFVTNPVTRHPSVHAADLAALESFYPGRTFLAMGTGDSAVHTVDLSPAAPDVLAAAFGIVRERVGPAMPLFMAVSGPRTAAAVPPAVDAIVIGGGLHAGWVEHLASVAEASAHHNLRRWLFLPSHLVAREDEVAAARHAIRPGVIGFSRHGLAGDKCRKGVPEELVEGLTAMYAQYVFREHALPGSANAALLARHPTEEAYLYERFAAVGTPDQIADQLSNFARVCKLDGVFLGAAVPDQEAHLRLVGELHTMLGNHLTAPR